MKTFFTNTLIKYTYIFFYLIFFSYLATHFFFLKRKADKDYSYFLIDPNRRVYCYIFAFFFFIAFFRLFYRFFFTIMICYKVFRKNEFLYISFLFFIFFYRFFWSYMFIDIDIKKTFFFESNTFSQKFKPREWEFSIYFFNFFGLFFDVYVYKIIYFCSVWFLFISFFNSFFEKFIMNILRICTFRIIIYCYSGETFLYDISRRLLLFFFFEFFIVLRYFFWIVFSYNKINL